MLEAKREEKMTQPPYVQRVVPCTCGSRDAYWHGPKEGLREYMCSACYAARSPTGRLSISKPNPQVIRRPKKDTNE